MTRLHADGTIVPADSARAWRGAGWMFGFDLLDWIVSESIRTSERTGCASAEKNDDIREDRVREEGWRVRGGSGGMEVEAHVTPKTVFLDLAPMRAVPVLLLICSHLHLHSMCD